MKKFARGFSLLEVMIAMAVVSFLSFTVLQLVHTNLQATKSVEITASLDNLVLEVNMALKDPAICQSNISNFSTTALPATLTGATIGLSKINLPSMTAPLVTDNTPLVNQPSTKISLDIEGIKQLSPLTYLANIGIGLDKGPSILGARHIARRVPISLTLTTAGGPITGCNTLGVGGPSGGGGATAGLTPSDVCGMWGQTLDPATNKCNGPAPGSGGTAPPPSGTPPNGCVAATTLCGGKSVPIPFLSEGGSFLKDWLNYDNAVGARCFLEISCKKGAWTNVSCRCV